MTFPNLSEELALHKRWNRGEIPLLRLTQDMKYGTMGGIIKTKNMTLSVSKKIFALAAAFALSVSVASYAFAKETGAAAADTTPPSDVEELSAQVGNNSVALTWQEAIDDTGVSGYRIYSGTDEVTSENTARYSQHIDVDAVTNYELTGLQSGTIYYIAVTALDAAGNESESYSPYVKIHSLSKVVALEGDVAAKETVTSISKNNSEKNEKDTVAPTVVSAESVHRSQVKVIFSETVKLPSEKPESAFTLQDNQILDYLAVKNAFSDPSDESGKTVLLDTADQNPLAQYLVTVGIGVEDSAGNPVSSGNRDFAQFKGSAMTPEEYLKLHPAAPKKTSEVQKSQESDGNRLLAAAPADALTDDELSIAKVEVLDAGSFKVIFSQPVVLSIDPTENFEIVKKDDEKSKVVISSLVVDDSKKEVVIKASLEPKTQYTLRVIGALDSTGKEISEKKSEYDFSSEVKSKDLTPPEDVSNFIAQAIETLAAKLKWTASKNTAGDLVEYILYQSGDGKSYGKITALSSENTDYTVKELQPGYHYFKVTARDGSGNESKGKIAKIRITETGPGIGFIVLASVGLGRFIRRKRR